MILSKDGTFKIIKKPFSQLFAIHAFIKGDDGNLKQIPIAYIMMSRREKKDYKKVLKALIKLAPGRLSQVEQVMVDYEIGLWQALRNVMPNVIIKGCSFHWGQAVWNKCQKLGLQEPHGSNENVKKFIRKILALKYLPHEHIIPAFEILCNEVSHQPTLTELCDYIKYTWIEGNWSPEDWSVFNMYVRTNNDTEGWHRRITSKLSAKA